MAITRPNTEDELLALKISRVPTPTPSGDCSERRLVPKLQSDVGCVLICNDAECRPSHPSSLLGS